MKRVLFVDDEPKILAGLRRLLYSLRHEWQMDFASGGPEALERLAREQYHVVVSDVRMPGMDGAELLRRVRDLHPGTMRVVLSGQCDRNTVLRCVAPAHQFLTKPCDSETLRNALFRAAYLPAQLNNDEVKQAVCRVQGLPCQVQTYAQLTTELANEKPAPDAVASLAGRDVAAAAKLLQLVSTGFFGSPQRVADPARAATLLGAEILQGLFKREDVLRPFDGSAELAEELAAINRRSLAVAASARTVANAQTQQRNVAGDAFAAGILQLLGSVVLLDVFPDRYREVLHRMHSGASRAEAEKQVFGVSHDEVGAYLAGLWGLPDPVVRALAEYRSPARSNQQQFTALTALHVAAACLSAEEGFSGDELEPDIGYLRRIGCAERLDHWRRLVAADLVQEATA